MKSMGFEKSNHFEVINWEFPVGTGKSQPEHITLSHKTAEYLAELPVRAFCTDAFSADCFGGNNDPIITDSQTANALPVHHSFL